MTDSEKRMKCALGLLANNLSGGGDWLEALKPISASFAAQMAELATAAYFDEPHEKLDEALRNWQFEA